jgi:hypothetical protein
MKITTEKYVESSSYLPAAGQHIVAHQVGNQLVVYQAYNPAIAEYAVKNQLLGGPNFSYNRMSWIKPNFLWMMYRCGWASKQNQERVLALWIDKSAFEEILQEAVFSSFDARFYDSSEAWKQELEAKEVRLQWDPDHDPHGGKTIRRAIQLGLKGKILEKFGKQQVRLIEDVTDFVRQQSLHVIHRQLEELLIPVERVYTLDNVDLASKLGVDSLIVN